MQKKAMMYLISDYSAGAIQNLHKIEKVSQKLSF